MKYNFNDYESVSNDFYNLIKILNEDIKIFDAYIKEDDRQVWRRAYTKAVFSSFESVIYFMKRFIKVIEKYDDLSLSEEQQKKLNEYYFTKTIEGKINKRIYRLSFLKNIAFTIELFAYSNYIFITVDKKCKEWKCLDNSIKIRNRITHPKYSTDLVIKDSEMNDINQAYQWFYKTIVNLLNDSHKELIAQAEGMESFLKKNQPNYFNPPDADR